MRIVKMSLIKISVMLILLVFLLSIGSGWAGAKGWAEGQKTGSANAQITEEIDVEWWAVPVFAVDNAGQSINNLQVSDIELKVGKHLITNFQLIKREFSKDGSRGVGQEPKSANALQPPAAKRKQNVFFLFDTTLSSEGSTAASQDIARRIITQADQNITFFIMTIEPFKGLVYIGGGIQDKQQLIQLIDTRVKGRNNARIPSPNSIVSDLSKYDEGELPFFKIQATKFIHRKNRSFFEAFETLYYILNTVEDNKFIYLFSEGVSRAVQEAEAGDSSSYRYDMNQVAEYLGRSSAVLFIINPFKSAAAKLSPASGADSLRLLAQASHGKYLEGANNDVISSIKNLHQAYYEIFFPTPQRSDKILDITVKARRPNIEIHSLSSLEKKRTYGEMKDIEREFLALNLISGNPLFNIDFPQQKADITDKEVSQDKNHIVYHLDIPSSFLNIKADLYKVFIKKTTDATDTRIEKETLKLSSSPLKITFKITPGEETYFAIIDPQGTQSLVCGIPRPANESYTLDLTQVETEEWATRELINEIKNKARESAVSDKPEDSELTALLTGAGQYCEKLKQAAFHYICQEKITETRKPLTTSATIQEEVTNTPVHPLFDRQTIEEIDRVQTLRSEKTETETHTFNYRLLNIAPQIKEERYIIKEKEEEKTGKETRNNENTRTEIKLRFISSKAIFGPVTILDSSRQEKYHFRLLEKTQIQDRPVAIIEAYPKNETDAIFIYGKIWIDTQDYSVLKIKANPNSLQGYDRLKKLADQVNSRLIINLETEFFELQGGIRFPTAIHFEESYKGGPLITGMRGSKGWTRTETWATYSDYMYFDVKTVVSYQE